MLAWHQSMGDEEWREGYVGYLSYSVRVGDHSAWHGAHGLVVGLDLIDY